MGHPTGAGVMGIMPRRRAKSDKAISPSFRMVRSPALWKLAHLQPAQSL